MKTVRYVACLLFMVLSALGAAGNLFVGNYGWSIACVVATVVFVLLAGWYS